MTNNVLSSAWNSNFDYQRRGELQKEKEEKVRRELNQRREADEIRQKEREQKASLIEKEKSLEIFERKKSLTAVLDLLMERNEKMKSAVEKGDLSKVATAQLIIDTATTKTGEYHQKQEEIRKKQKKKIIRMFSWCKQQKKRRHSKNKNKEVTVNSVIKTIYNLISIFFFIICFIFLCHNIYFVKSVIGDYGLMILFYLLVKRMWGMATV